MAAQTQQSQDDKLRSRAQRTYTLFGGAVAILHVPYSRGVTDLHSVYSANAVSKILNIYCYVKQHTPILVKYGYGSSALQSYLRSTTEAAAAPLAPDFLQLCCPHQGDTSKLWRDLEPFMAPKVYNPPPLELGRVGKPSITYSELYKAFRTDQKTRNMCGVIVTDLGLFTSKSFLLDALTHFHLRHEHLTKPREGFGIALEELEATWSTTLKRVANGPDSQAGPGSAPKKAKPSEAEAIAEVTLDSEMSRHLKYQEAFLSLLATNSTTILGMINKLVNQNDMMLQEIKAIKQRENIVVNLDDIPVIPLQQSGAVTGEPEAARKEAVSEDADPFAEDPADPVGEGAEVPPPSILDDGEVVEPDTNNLPTVSKSKRKSRQ